MGAETAGVFGTAAAGPDRAAGDAEIVGTLIRLDIKISKAQPGKLSRNSQKIQNLKSCGR
jgi:hypothetical protein